MSGLLLLVVLGTLLLVAFYLAIPASQNHTETDTINTATDMIEALLPQTQCGQCHYPGCRPYAEAIANGNAEINQCPPGGELTMLALARLLGRAPEPLSQEALLSSPQQVAVIDEELCIGCVKCIKACPVDAIMGAPKLMHTVIKQYCTGCTLCVDPCPVNCISMVPVRVKTKEWVWAKPDPSLRLQG